MSEPLSRATLRKLSLESVEREQRREEEGWRLGEEQLAALSTTFQTVQTEFHDLDGLVWSQSDSRLRLNRHALSRRPSLTHSPSNKPIRHVPRAKPMSTLTNLPLPPVPPSANGQQLGDKRESSPTLHRHVSFDSSQSRFSDAQDTVRAKPTAGRVRALCSFSADNIRPAATATAASHSHFQDNSHSSPCEDPDSTIVYERPQSSLGFFDTDDNRNFDYIATIKPSQAATALGLGLSIANASRQS